MLLSSRSGPAKEHAPKKKLKLPNLLLDSGLIQPSPALSKACVRLAIAQVCTSSQVRKVLGDGQKFEQNSRTLSLAAEAPNPMRTKWDWILTEGRGQSAVGRPITPCKTCLDEVISIKVVCPHYHLLYTGTDLHLAPIMSRHMMPWARTACHLPAKLQVQPVIHRLQLLCSSVLLHAPQHQMHLKF